MRRRRSNVAVVIKFRDVSLPLGGGHYRQRSFKTYSLARAFARRLREFGFVYRSRRGRRMTEYHWPAHAIVCVTLSWQ